MGKCNQENNSSLISYAAKITQPCMGFANKMAQGVSKGILGAEHESGFLG